MIDRDHRARGSAADGGACGERDGASGLLNPDFPHLVLGINDAKGAATKVWLVDQTKGGLTVDAKADVNRPAAASCCEI